jgi:hypothetical protein
MIAKYISVQNHKTNITKHKKLNKKSICIGLIALNTLFLLRQISNLIYCTLKGE